MTNTKAKKPTRKVATAWTHETLELLEVMHRIRTVSPRVYRAFLGAMRANHLTNHPKPAKGATRSERATHARTRAKVRPIDYRRAAVIFGDDGAGLSTLLAKVRP